MSKAMRERLHKAVDRAFKKQRKQDGSSERPSSTAKEHRPSALVYFRAVGFASLMGTVAAMLIQEFFWQSIGLICFGVLVLLLDALIDHEIAFGFRIGIVSILVVFSVWFSVWVIFPKADLHTEVMEIKHEDDDQSDMFGIQWKPEFSDVRLVFMNQSSSDYMDLQIEISTDQYVVDAKQITKHPNVELESNMLLLGWLERGIPAMPPSVAGTQIAARCERLRAGTALDLILAVATSPTNIASPTNYSPRTSPKLVTVSATYKWRFFRPRKMSCKAIPAQISPGKFVGSSICK
jgi:hypothetical protein